MMSLVSTPLSVARVAAPKKAIRKTVTAKASAADAAKSAAVCAALDPAALRSTGHHHPCCLCHAPAAAAERRLTVTTPLRELPVDPTARRAKRALRASLERRRLQSVGGGDSQNMACFPADATVRLADGTTKTMAQLQLGDAVLDASGDGEIQRGGARRVAQLRPGLRPQPRRRRLHARPRGRRRGRWRAPLGAPDDAPGARA